MSKKMTREELSSLPLDKFDADKINKLPLSQALEVTGRRIAYRVAYTRIKRLGWSVFDAVTRPASENSRQSQKYTFDGKEMSLSEIAEATKIPRATLYHRLKNGWDQEKAFTTPVTRGQVDPMDFIEA